MWLSRRPHWHLEKDTKEEEAEEEEEAAPACSAKVRGNERSKDGAGKKHAGSVSWLCSGLLPWPWLFLMHGPMPFALGHCFCPSFMALAYSFGPGLLHLPWAMLVCFGFLPLPGANASTLGRSEKKRQAKAEAAQQNQQPDTACLFPPPFYSLRSFPLASLAYTSSMWPAP